MTEPMRVVRTAVIVGLLVVAAGSGVASAAVSGDFSSSYDGYNDGSDTDVAGHEIQASGSLEFTGENAVNARITVREGERAIIERPSVRLLQPGDSSIDFEKRYTEQGVLYTADEIPAGTTLDLSFTAYPVSGLTQNEITTAQIIVSYQLPGGDDEREQIDVTTSLSNTPPQVISSLESGDRNSLLVQGLAVVGAIALLLVVVMGVYSAVSGGSDNPLE